MSSLRELGSEEDEYDVSHQRYYTIPKPEDGWRTVDSFSQEEKYLLRPIAETIAMLDGNAFFPHDNYTWYEQYLPEAHALFERNGGIEGWAGTSHLARIARHENEAVREAYESWLMLKTLASPGSHEG